MNADQIQPLLDFMMVMMVCCSRILGFCSVSIFFSSQYLTGTVRRAIILALSLLVLPRFYSEGYTLLYKDQLIFFGFALKEILLGTIIGWLTNFIFYAAQCVGFLIDSQRGASMASMFDPLSNSQTSPLGDFLLKFVMIISFICGAFLGLMELLYVSFEQIPIFSTVQLFHSWGTLFFNIQMGTQLFEKVLLLGGPVFFLLFLAEFGLGLVTRFAPQLNVFFLAMPIKSELAMFFFVLYLSYLARYFCITFKDHMLADKFIQLLL